jgi:hypothetical protein
MKKFTILALLLMLIGIAAADVYTIGDGTSTQNYIPFYGYYDYGWSKVVYTAAELSTAGLSAGQIDGIGFEVGNTPSNYVSVDQRVFIRHTTATELDATYPDNTQFQNVYQANYTWNGAGWHHIMFSSPFIWDGTSNIEILWENWDGAWASGPNFTYTSTSPSYLAAYKYQDGSFPTTDGSTTYNRPNIQIVTPSTNPPAPATLVSPAHQSTLTDAIVTLSWSASDGAIPTGYTLFYGTTNPPLNEVDLGPLTSHVLNDLPFNTLYYWQVVPYNAMGSATGCPIWEFTTMADPTQPLPYLQDFEAPTTLADINWSGTFSIMTNHGTSGSKGLSRNLWSSVATATATTCPIGPLAPDSELKFDYRYVNYGSYPSTPFTPGAGDQLLVQVSNDNVNFTTVHTIDMNNHVTSTAFAQVTVDLAAYSGTIYLKFDATWATGDYYLDIDNVLVREVPVGPPDAPTLASPANGATGLAKYGFDLSWTPATTGGDATSYTIYMAQDEAMIYDELSFNDITTTSFNPVTEGSVAFNYLDRWYWTVEAVNNDGSALPDNPFWFDIEADPTLYVGPESPWTEGFEGATFPPTGWSMNDADTDGQNWFLYNADASAHTGLYSAASASWTGTTGALTPDNWLITPPIAIPATGEYLMEYYVGAQDPDYPQDHYGLYISTTGTAPADFSLLFEETLMDGAWYYRSQNLASYAGQTVHFAFRHFDSYDWFYMKIDDVTVRELPETPTLAISPTEWDFGSVQLLNPTTPKSFSLSNVGAGTIDILAGDIQLTGDAEGNFVLVANDLPASLTGSTTYPFTVQFIPQSLGTKTATVTVEDNLTRVLHTIELSGECVEEPIASVIALQGAVETQVNVRLNWASIYGDPTQAGYVHWDDSIQRGNVGAGATPFHAVAKYGTEVTALAAGKVLDGVMIHIAEEPQLITSVKVWTGTDADLAPLTMVHEETVSDLTVGWNYVALTTPVPITGTDAIYVGYYSTGMLDVFPASTDGLTAVNGRGNVLEIGGSWTTLTSSSIAGSWLIHAHFAEAAPIMAGRRPVVLQNVAVNNVEMTDEALRNSPVKARMNGNVDRVLRGFNVYRDGVQINSEIVAAYTYLDEGLAADTYDYAAQAVHYSANGPISGTIPVTVDPPADPIALPFLEDWASSGYDTNMWSVGSSNWVMNTTTGNPAPSASFSWSPQVTDYSSVLASYEFDATGIASVQFSFDLYLNNYSTDAENTMTWEVWDGSAWNTLGSYSSLDDDLLWTTYAYDISAYAANRVFKIRFVAAGEDSYEINYWYLDNIYLAFLPSTMDPITDLSISTDGVTIDLAWTAVPNATWYMIYASEDPYATFTPMGFVPTAGASLPTSALPTDKAFVKVTAGTGPFPAMRNLSE